MQHQPPLVVGIKTYMRLFNINLMFYSTIASKGIGANFLKVGTKRRRTTAQIVAEKEEAAVKEVALQERLAKAIKLETEAANNKNAANILTDFIKQGIAVQDAQGNITVPSASKQKHPPK